MPDVDFELRGGHVELHALLKLVGAADSGGQGKALVATGRVEVDGQPEMRKSAKIRAGQVVTCDDLRIHVKAPA
jgi:ribosome-associated protein